jgi:hypothetical protein
VCIIGVLGFCGFCVFAVYTVITAGRIKGTADEYNVAIQTERTKLDELRVRHLNLEKDKIKYKQMNYVCEISLILVCILFLSSGNLSSGPQIVQKSKCSKRSSNRIVGRSNKLLYYLGRLVNILLIGENLVDSQICVLLCFRNRLPISCFVAQFITVFILSELQYRTTLQVDYSDSTSLTGIWIEALNKWNWSLILELFSPNYLPEDRLFPIVPDQQYSNFAWSLILGSKTFDWRRYLENYNVHKPNPSTILLREHPEKAHRANREVCARLSIRFRRR